MTANKFFGAGAGVVALTLGLLATGASHAVAIAPVGYGTNVTTTTNLSCQIDCFYASAVDGGSGSVEASATQGTFGTARGTAGFAPNDSYLPILRAYSRAESGKWATATSFASQLFTYSGTGGTVELNLNLTGTVQPNSTGDQPYTAIFTNTAVVKGSSLAWNPDYNSLISGPVVWSERVLARQFLGYKTPDQSSATATLSFDLAQGDSFFVVSQLSATATNGMADAEHTFTMSFDSTSKAFMQAATAPVPELGTATLSVAGLLALAWVGQRRRSAAAVAA